MVKGKEPECVNEYQRMAMKHGTDCEVHKVATMCGIIFPLLYPDLKFYEECYYVKDNVLVSPDGRLRKSDNSVLYAFERKAPIETTHKPTLHEEVPRIYISQTLLESRVLGTQATLYLCWSNSS